MIMKKEVVGTLVRSRSQPAIKDEEGKLHLLYNLFDGFAGKKVKVTVESMES